MMNNHEVSMAVLEHVVGGLWGYNAEEHLLYSGIFAQDQTGIKETGKERTGTSIAPVLGRQTFMDYPSIIYRDDD